MELMGAVAVEDGFVGREKWKYGWWRVELSCGGLWGWILPDSWKKKRVLIFLMVR
jgi:hypothetical protein